MGFNKWIKKIEQRNIILKYLMFKISLRTCVQLRGDGTLRWNWARRMNTYCISFSWE